jgi:hypothetical protein
MRYRVISPLLALDAPHTVRPGLRDMDEKCFDLKLLLSYARRKAHTAALWLFNT